MPANKPSEIFQGSDWLTYRWTVAQAFDTLDRIRDLCLQMPVNVSVPGGKDAPRFEGPGEEVADMFGYIVELCDDLAGELDMVLADLFSLVHGSINYGWVAVEMRMHLKDLRQRALKEANTESPLMAPPDATLDLAARIRTLLKQIDQ